MWWWMTAIDSEITELVDIVDVARTEFTIRKGKPAVEMQVHPSLLEDRITLFGIDVIPGPTGFKNVVKVR